MRRDRKPALDDALANAGFVRGVARAVLGGDDRVEDVVQDAWLTLARSGPRREGALRAWLAVVSRNLSYRVLRGAKRRVARERRAARDERVPDVAEIAASEDVRRRLVAALVALEDPYRAALLLRYYEDLSVAEVALLLGVPLETARTRLRRGLERLRERLDDEHRGDRRAWAIALAPFVRPPRMSPAPALLEAIAMKKAVAIVAACFLFGWIGWISFGPEESHDAPRAAQGPSVLSAPESPEGTASLAIHTSRAQARPELATTSQARGRIVDAVGKPVPGARVLAWRDDLDEIVDPEAAQDGRVSVTLADESGAFTIQLRGKAPAFTLLATAAGLSSMSVPDVQPGDDVTIELPPSESIRGTVRDLDERPVAGALISWTGFVGGARVGARAISATDGAYRIEGLSRATGLDATQQVMSVAADGYAIVRVSRIQARSRSVASCW